MPSRSTKQKVSTGILRRSDQAVLEYLNELAQQGKGETCTASITEIASACSISKRQVQISTGRLIEARLLERVGYDLSNPDRAKRGTVYKVLSQREGKESHSHKAVEEDFEDSSDNHSIMMTKTTLAYGKNFHFYQEGRDNNFVYLELEDIPYDAGYRRIMVAIPVDVWEVIRHLGEGQLALVDVPDDELEESVKKKVDKRIAEYMKVKSSNPEEAELLRFDDSAVYGGADEDREQQISRGMQYFMTERQRQQGIAARMAQHKIIDIKTESSEGRFTDI